MELGAGALFAIMILKVVFDFMKEKRDKNGLQKKIENIEDSVKRTFDLHNHFDNDGVPLWFVPRSWADIQKDISESQRAITLTLQEISNTQKSIAKTLERIEAK